jgi:hypothetical protein
MFDNKRHRIDRKPVSHDWLEIHDTSDKFDKYTIDIRHSALEYLQIRNDNANKNLYQTVVVVAVIVVIAVEHYCGDCLALLIKEEENPNPHACCCCRRRHHHHHHSCDCHCRCCC